MFRLVAKGAEVKKSLKAWNKGHVGNIFKKAKQLDEEITRLLIMEENGMLSASMNGDLRQLTSDYHNVIRLQEFFWKQKLRISWLKEGDANNSFFHRATISRRARNLIKKFKESEGVFLRSEVEISNHFYEYFCERWRPSNVIGNDGELEMIPMLVTEKDNELLCAPVTRNEIWKVVKSMLIDKVPEPDGLPVGFS